jgi:hypothetical protein
VSSRAEEPFAADISHKANHSQEENIDAYPPKKGLSSLSAYVTLL